MSNTVERTVERADGPDRVQTSAGSARFGTIDGIRAYAIILIVLSHCLILNQGGGRKLPVFCRERILGGFSA